MNPKKPNPKRSFWSSANARWFLRIGLFAFSALFISLILVVEKDPTVDGGEFTVGEPAPRSLFSPFDLAYTDAEATEAIKRQAARKIPPVYRVKFSAADSLREKVDQVLAIVHDFRIRKMETPDLASDSLNLSLELSGPTRQFLIETADLEELRKQFGMLFEVMGASGVLETVEKNDLLGKNIQEINIITKDGTETVKLVKEVDALEESKSKTGNILKGFAVKNRMERDTVLEIFNLLLTANLSFDESQTKERQLKASEKVEPIRASVKKNELIVQRGLIVNASHKSKIDQIRKLMVKQRAVDKFLSIGILVFLVSVLGFVYLFIFERKLLLSFRMLLLLQSTFLLSLAVCKIISLWSGTNAYFMPVAMAPLLLALLVNPHIAILSSIAMSILVAPMVGFSADVMVAVLLSAGAGVLASRKVRKRIHFFRIGAAIGVTNFLVIFAFQTLKGGSFQEYFFISLQGLANGILVTTPIVFLLIPIFESLFGVVTDITLLELSDLNHPLLKRMIVEAPGTYHHSLVVATLAESACEAIGANALLARVGCYFHDIGKIAQAEYFTENEAKDAGIRHEKLTPTMSCLIILNHVKDGMELGRRYKLREPILQFIPEHQGTGVIYYFYKKAMDQSGPGQRVDADDFRYPGPKPQSRETAVALLADSTEAASRSLKNLTPESIRQLVRKIINDKFIDGQLEECNLTLRDLHQIQEKFVQNLMAIYHTRVSYPDKPQSADRPDLFQIDEFAKYRTEPH